MDNLQTSEKLENPSTNAVVQEHQPSSPKIRSKEIIFAMLFFLLGGAIFGLAGYYLGLNIQSRNYEISEEPETEILPTTTLTPTTEVTPTQEVKENTTPTIKVVNGADLKDIKFTLPANWESKLSSGSIFIAPKTGGGYLNIMVYDYPTDTGRRAFYCKTRDVCIDVTSFSEMKIGNISGYKAQGIDNSGGGVEYFGAKGNKFYIISSYGPPPPNEFEANYLQVLDSLVF